MQDLDELLRSSLSNQHYVGRRQALWEEQTAVQIILTEPPMTQPPLPISDRKDVLAALISGVVRVQFLNAKSEVTVMDCTLSRSVIPEAELQKLHNSARDRLTLAELVLAPDPTAEIAKIPKENPNLIRVWSTDRNGWRSFRLERVQEIKEFK